VQVSLTSRERLPRVALWIVIVAVGSAAMTGCGSAGASNTASVPHRAFQFSRCMRTCGVPQFPDPGPNGIQFPVTSPIPQSPSFQRVQNGPCKST
jgi:hypothetical protein